MMSLSLQQVVHLMGSRTDQLKLQDLPPLIQPRVQMYVQYLSVLHCVFHVDGGQGAFVSSFLLATSAEYSTVQ